MLLTKRLIALLIITILLNSCKEDNELNKFDNQMSSFELDDKFYDKQNTNNKHRNKIAKNLAKSLQNEAFRTYVYNEAKKEIDGDYNLYIRKLYEDLENGKLSFGSEVESVLSKNEAKHIQSIDPNLTISIPANFEKWNPATETPIVCYLPNYFKEGELKFLRGYNSEGKNIKIDADQAPERPIIVLRKSESIPDNFDFEEAGTNEAIADYMTQSAVRVKEPILLPGPECEYETAPGRIETASATVVGNYLQFNWSAASNATGYMLYKYTTNATYESIGYTNNTYYDYTPSITDPVSYYKIEARNCKGTSFIGVSTDDCLPDAPIATSVEAKPNGIYVKWNKVDNATGYHLDYWADGESKRRKTISSGNTVQGIITGYTSGKHINILLSAYNQCGRLASSKYIGAYYSTRSNDKYFTIDYINYYNRVEPWYLGNLDWRVKLVMQTENNPSTETYNKQFEFKTVNYNNFGYRDNDDYVQTGVNKKLLIWKAEESGYICNFGIVEYDYLGGEGNDELILDVKVKLSGTKETKWGENEGTATANWKGVINFRNIEDEVWDPHYIYHWQNPNYIYTFSEKNHSKGEIEVKFTESY